MSSPAVSFRDPEGFCVELDRRIFRVIHSESALRVRSLLESPLIQRWLADGVLPQMRILEAHEALGIVAQLGEVGLRAGSEPLVLEHERIGFPAYAAEWCPEMLFATGQNTLEWQRQALEEGWTLKDATPDNVLFAGVRPRWVDLLSVVPRESSATLWPAYGQFVRTFLLPLLLNQRTQTPLSDVFLSRRDGLEPAEVYQRLSAWGRWSPITFSYVTLATWLGRRAKTRKVTLQAADHPGDPARSLFVARMVLRRLQRTFARLRPSRTSGSNWIEYPETHSYPAAAVAAKEEFVRAALLELRPRTVLDVGCNTGAYSRLAAAAGCDVVAVDSDPAVVAAVWNEAQTRGQNILPLVGNLARPTPGMGWRNREQKAFLDRAKGYFDCAMLLAVVHHLTITEGVPYAELFQLLSHLEVSGVIVEHVGPGDSMVQRLIVNREHLLPRLEAAVFEDAFKSHFGLVRRLRLPETERTLYLLRRKP